MFPKFFFVISWTSSKYYLVSYGWIKRTDLNPTLSSPLKSTKNQCLRVKHGRTLKYRQLLGSRKKLGSIPRKLGPYRGNQNFSKNAENRDFKKFAIWNLLPTRLCRAATTKPRQIERSSFFLVDHNDQTRIYRLISGSFDVPLQRKRDSPVEEDDCPPPLPVR